MTFRPILPAFVFGDRKGRLPPKHKNLNFRTNIAIRRQRQFSTKLFPGSVIPALLLLPALLLPDYCRSQPFSSVFSPASGPGIIKHRNRLLVPVAVFGRDQRRRLPKSYKKLDQQIGLLHNPRTNTLCTAFCVAPDMIATASHCLFTHRKNRKLHLSSLLFRLKSGKKNRPVYSRMAGYRSGHTRRYIITGTSKLHRKPPIGAARDWAIIRLDKPACRNGWLKTVKLSYPKLQQASKQKKLFQVAYHMDFRNWQIAYSGSCPVRRDFGGLSWRSIKKHFASPDALVLHRCDTAEASSGSPLLMESKAGPVVVGINVGTYQQRETIVKNGRVIRRTKFRTIANTAVSSNAFLPKLRLLKQARILRNSSDIRKLQRYLHDRRYYRGAIDGIYGARTESAIKAYERATAHPVTGLASRNLLDELENRNAMPISIRTSAGHGSSPPVSPAR